MELMGDNHLSTVILIFVVRRLGKVQKENKRKKLLF